MRPEQVDLAAAARHAVQAIRLPEVLGLREIAAVFGFRTRSGARRAAIRGDFGAFARVGRKLIFRRESVLAALASREATPREGLNP